MKKILVVDDNQDILQVIGLVLEYNGYTVKCWDSGFHLSKTVRDYKPDLILLDIMLRGYDGRQLCKDLKNNRSTTTIPIIMVSASHHSTAQTVIDCQANDFITKPFDMDDLLNKVGSYIN